tara:strand:+ start:891 stop:1232 length:342 start_codon:yes stop_codon:yes gene_type:complete
MLKHKDTSATDGDGFDREVIRTEGYRLLITSSDESQSEIGRVVTYGECFGSTGSTGLCGPDNLGATEKAYLIEASGNAQVIRLPCDPRRQHALEASFIRKAKRNLSAFCIARM